MAVTSANAHDSTMIQELLHGDETRVWGDSAYTGKKDDIKEVAPNAKDFTHRKSFRHRPLTEKDTASNKVNSKIRAKVEHCFGVMKNRFGFRKVRYKGLDKNAHHVFVPCALVNLALACKQLLKVRGQRA